MTQGQQRGHGDVLELPPPNRGDGEHMERKEMADEPSILAFAGSTRADSFNKKMVRIAADGARAAGVQVTLIDLRDYAMPLYDGDLEAAEGLPATAQAFKQLMIEHDGFLIAAPEYNSSISAVLKNTIDWVSRPVPDEPRLVAFQGKVAALMSAAAGGFGGVRSLAHVRTILGNIGVLVLPDQVTLSQAMRAFQPDGNLEDEGMQARVAGLGARLATFLQQLKK